MDFVLRALCEMLAAGFDAIAQYAGPDLLALPSWLTSGLAGAGAVVSWLLSVPGDAVGGTLYNCLVLNLTLAVVAVPIAISKGWLVRPRD